MEVFVEEHEVAPVRVGLKFFVAAVDSAASRFVAREGAYQTVGEAARDVVELYVGLAGDGAVDYELLAVSLRELAQRLDHHERGREPDGAAPVRVAALQILRGLGGLVADLRAAGDERVLLVKLREAAEAVLGAELRRIPDALQQPAHLFGRDHREDVYALAVVL